MEGKRLRRFPRERIADERGDAERLAAVGCGAVDVRAVGSGIGWIDWEAVTAPGADGGEVIVPASRHFTDKPTQPPCQGAQSALIRKVSELP